MEVLAAASIQLLVVAVVELVVELVPEPAVAAVEGDRQNRLDSVQDHRQDCDGVCSDQSLAVAAVVGVGWEDFEGYAGGVGWLRCAEDHRKHFLGH